MPHTTETHVFDHTNTVNARTVRVEPAPASSVEIATDAKGQPKPTVTVYHEDPQQARPGALAFYRACLTQLPAPAPPIDHSTIAL